MFIWPGLKTKRLFLLLIALGAFLSFEKDAVCESAWFVTMYGGRFADNELIDIAFVMDSPTWKDSYLAAFGIGRELVTFGKYFRFELEGQIVKHFGERVYLHLRPWRDVVIRSVGKQDHFEFNGVLIFRWLLFPWDKYLDTSFAIGDGLSYATQPPPLEGYRDWDREANGVVWFESENLLNYVLLELAFSLPQIPQWSVFTRIHHRSGTFGLLGTDEGSNFICWGLRYDF